MIFRLGGFVRATQAICLLCLSCGSGNEQIKQDYQSLKQVVAQQQEDIKGLHTDLDKFAENFYCTNDEVRAFIRRCEKTPGAAIQCSDEAVAGALAFLDSQPYVAFYLRPAGATSLTKVRDGQLTELIDPANLRKSTKFLILVQPRAETAEATEEASTVANGIYQYMRTGLGLSGGQPVYQHVLPCKLKAETMRHYMRRADRLQTGEPTEKEPRLRVWVFRTACGN